MRNAKLTKDATSGDPTACSPGDSAKVKVTETTFANTKLNVVKVDWKEVYYTNCPLVSASNVDQELGWTREEYKKIGVKYQFLRAVRENDWYPHYIHTRTTSSASVGYSRPFRFTRTSAGPGSWG
jgi:hypothetical protein